MALTLDPVPGPQGPGILRRISRWWGDWPLTQLAVILTVIALFWLFGHNTAATMARVGITPGFDFLARPANFEIGEAPIAFAAGDPYARAILAGFLNTIRVAVLGCVFATLLGVLLGIAGLSGNLLLAVLVRWYVEVIRNTPLLLQLFFWIALAKSFPPPRQAVSAFHSFFLSNRGVFLPGLVLHDATAITWSATIGLVLVFGVGSWLLWRGGQLTVKRFSVGILALAIGIVAIFALTGARAGIELPVMAGFNIRGGYNLTPEFAALLTGLVVKFSAAIAEIVRAGILSVNRGQWEAARALGLRNGQIMRLIVLPQALRIIAPLTTSSYLDLIKDSSLAVAIGYPDLVSIVGTTANTTGQSFEALAILIAIYLAINLSVSAAMNVYNRRVALRGTVRA